MERFVDFHLHVKILLGIMYLHITLPFGPPCYNKIFLTVQYTNSHSYGTHMPIFHYMYISYSLPPQFSCNFSFAHQFIIPHGSTNALSLVAMR